MWMSEARCSTARLMSRFTKRMTGASEARSRRWSTSSSSSPKYSISASAGSSALPSAAPRPAAPLLLETLHLARVVLAEAPLLEQGLLERGVLELHQVERILVPLLSGKPSPGRRKARQDARRRRQSPSPVASVSASAIRGLHPVSAA